MNFGLILVHISGFFSFLLSFFVFIYYYFFEQTMAWILDEYSKFHGYSPAVVTGKPTVSRYRERDTISRIQLYL